MFRSNPIKLPLKSRQENCLQSYKATLEELTRKLLALKKEFDPGLTKDLEAKLAETVTEIGALQKEMRNAKGLDSIKTVASQLNDAKTWWSRLSWS
ncbi:WEB family protein [Camellia lanceoleosa]|uniref:WEB family protein n=1 Tax=Camellia lanceoleosa TaxID=1840588 RepID=A0ACC0HB38_9ERIC|nr:WEB family protein [Camellia lanceoleosa]